MKTQAQKTELSPETTRQRMFEHETLIVSAHVHGNIVCSSWPNQTTLNYIQTSERADFFMLLRLSKIKHAGWILCIVLVLGGNYQNLFSGTDKQGSEQQISKKNIVSTKLIFS